MVPPARELERAHRGEGQSVFPVVLGIALGALLAVALQRLAPARPAPREGMNESRLIFTALEGIRRGTPADLAQSHELLEEYDRRFPRGAYEEEALFYLAHLAEQLHQPEEARAWASQFLSRFPGSSRATDVRGVLRRAPASPQ